MIYALIIHLAKLQVFKALTNSNDKTMNNPSISSKENNNSFSLFKKNIIFDAWPDVGYVRVSCI